VIVGHDVLELHAQASHRFGELLRQVGADDWALPTACPAWTVRALVDHVVRWNRAVPRQLAGASLVELTDLGDADILGTDPVAAWHESAQAAIEALARPGALDVLVHTPIGQVPGAQLALFRFDDNLVHGWDLARAIDVPEQLDPDHVTACYELVEPTAAYLPATGLFAAPPALPPGADAQARPSGGTDSGRP